MMWNGIADDEPLAADGGAKRAASVKHQMMEKQVSYQATHTVPQMVLLDKPQPAKRKETHARKRSD